MNNKISESIADLLKTRSILTLMVYGTTCYLCCLGKPIPIIMETGCKFLFGVWFGEKAFSYIKNGKSNGGTNETQVISNSNP